MVVKVHWFAYQTYIFCLFHSSNFGIVGSHLQTLSDKNVLGLMLVIFLVGYIFSFTIYNMDFLWRHEESLISALNVDI